MRGYRVCVKTNPDLQLMRIKDRVPVLEAVPSRWATREERLEAALGCATPPVKAHRGRRRVAGRPQDPRDHERGLAIGATRRAGRRSGARRHRPGRRRLGPGARPRKGGPSSWCCSAKARRRLLGPGASRVAELLGLPEIGYARSLAVAGAVLRAERSMARTWRPSRRAAAAATLVSEINSPHPHAHEHHEAGRSRSSSSRSPTSPRPPRSRRGAPYVRTWPKSSRASTCCSTATGRTGRCPGQRAGRRRRPGR